MPCYLVPLRRFRHVQYILLASSQSASRTPDALLGILVLSPPTGLMHFLECWLSRYQGAGCIFWNAGSTATKTPDAFLGILVLSLPQRLVRSFGETHTIVPFISRKVLALQGMPFVHDVPN
jgi:hypothetical protein